jgi:(p)ppGpp synthase/HD superfamily hydrolase
MSRENKLLTWVKQQHKGQLIKRTTEPYINHLTAVAQMAAVTPLGYEIGLCHDLIEKTETTAQQLQAALEGFGYAGEDAAFITTGAIHLTNVFTKKAYPELTKTIRKEKEAVRLATISPTAQTVKYADLIYNIGWLLQHGRKKPKKYLQKKRLLVAEMTGGDEGLRQHLLYIIDKELVTA